jgi:hypothetical protein
VIDGFFLYRVQKYLTLKLFQVIGGTKPKLYCEATVCQTCILAVPRTFKVGLPRVGNQAKPLKVSEKKVIFCTNLEQMFKRMAANLDTQPMMIQQRLTSALRNARLLPPQQYEP